MNRIRKHVIAAAILLITGSLCPAQDFNSLKTPEAMLAALFNQITQAGGNLEKEKICDAISDTLDTLLLQSSTFHYPFDSLRTLGKVYSPDGRLRFYTWNLPYRDGTNRFYGMLQYKEDELAVPVLYRLSDAKDDLQDPLQAVLQGNRWYGSLVYEIVQAAFADTTFYILLGYAPFNLFISKKTIDILYFSREGPGSKMRPVFGKPVFQVGDSLQSRVVFAYSARAQMALQWNEQAEMIVFDHLSPFSPSYEGNYQYYGPDFSYDGFIFDSRRWHLVEDIDIRNIQE